MTNAAKGRGVGYRRTRRRWENDLDVRFMTFSCYRRMPLLRPAGIRDVFVQTLREAKDKHAFSVYAYVVMPEHVHLIFRPAPGGRWATIGQSIKISMARRVLDKWKELNAPILSRLRTPSGPYRFWQHGGGFDRNIRDESELAKEIQYTHRNPVRRGLVARPEDWAWSSVHSWMGVERPDQVACELPPGNQNAWLAWQGFK